jgi:hypothetical protein
LIGGIFTNLSFIIFIVRNILCFIQPVLAQESQTPAVQKEETGKKMAGPWRNFNIDLGVALTALDSSVQFGSSSLGIGVVVDVEDALGLDSSDTVFFANGYYRFGKSRRHRFDFGYAAYRRDSSKVLLNNVPIFDDTLPAGSTVSTEFNFDIIKAGYSYSLLQDDRMDLGIGAGLYIMPIEFSFTSTAIGAKQEDITAPLPVLGLRGDFAITRKLFLKMAWDIFYLKIGDFEGSIMSGLLAIEYNFWKNVGFGLGYNDFRVHVEAHGSDYPNLNFFGDIDFEYRALNFYTKIFF